MRVQACSELADSGAAAANSGRENSRPMTAPIWAISLAGPSRSRRAVKESSSDAGTARGGRGPAAMCRSPTSWTNWDSNTLLVSSSTNKGTPSALLMICSSTSRGSALSPITSEIIARLCSRPSRSRRSIVTCGSLSHCGMNSGRNFMRKKIRAVLISGIILLTSSSVLESIQCASATTTTRGCLSARLKRCRLNAAIVRSFCRRGVKSDDSSRSGVAIDNNAAYNKISSWSVRRPETARLQASRT